jgi:hypothetical protein
MKKYNIHGIVAMVLFLISFGVGVVAVSKYSIALGTVALFLVLLSFVSVSVIYCSKCKCRNNCNHVIFGKISILLSKYNPDNYILFDVIVGLLPMLIAIVFPQYWIVKNITFVLCYWIPMVIGGLEAFIFLCPKCLNSKCKMCRDTKI